MIIRGLICLMLWHWAMAVGAAPVPKELPYPEGEPDPRNVAAQVYFVNHFYALKNYAIEKKGDKVTTVITRPEGGSTITTNAVERYVNNDYHDGSIKSKDLVIFRSGRLRGTGMLITDYLDAEQSQSYAIWLPALRRIRHFSEPAHDDAWSGSDFTFGDVYLRKPDHESHELLGKEIFQDCLGFMDIPEADRNKYTRELPEPSCVAKGREVYKLKSTTHFEDWWYDYRISYVDTETFADYRTDYFKDGKHIKVIDRDWRPLKGYQDKDPRALSWGYWYGKNLENGHESWAVIPPEVVTFNGDFPNSLWTESTLRKIRR